MLNVLFRCDDDAEQSWHHGETEEENSTLVSAVMASLKHENPSSQWVDPGEDAWFCFSDQPFERVDSSINHPDALLRVAVNRSTGFGALVWFAERSRTEWADISDRIWISDNPRPPTFDARVVADPGYPLFHHPRSTLPIEDIRAALEEFCRAGTGMRPKCIRWTEGDVSGRRADVMSTTDVAGDPIPQNPWD